MRLCGLLELSPDVLSRRLLCRDCNGGRVVELSGGDRLGHHHDLFGDTYDHLVTHDRLLDAGAHRGTRDDYHE